MKIYIMFEFDKLYSIKNFIKKKLILKLDEKNEIYEFHEKS